MKKSYKQIKQDDGTYKLVEMDGDSYRQQSAAIFCDIEPYISPASGLVIDGRRARREDLRATNSRPYERGEKEHAAKVQQENIKREERQLERTVQEVANSMRF